LDRLKSLEVEYTKQYKSMLSSVTFGQKDRILFS